MEDLKNDIGILTDNVKELVETEVEIVKLQAVDHISHYAASIFSRFIFTVIGVVAYALAIAALGIYLNEVLNSEWLGLLIVSGGTLVALLILFFARRELIERPVQDLIIKNISSKMEL